MATLDDWVAQATAALGLPVDAVDTRAVLDLARVVAHGVDRPAAPVTAYLAGLAVGRGAAPSDVDERLRALLPVDPRP